MFRTGLLAIAAVVCSWLWMTAVHEFGHVLHAWLSGGTVERVILHPLTISRTDVRPNPAPRFVVWGGPIWGCLLPVAVWAAVRRWRYAYLPAFFAGFCLIANGCYLGTGAIMPVGDAEVLRQSGTPAWQLIAFGLITIPPGLWLWNGLGRHFGFGPDSPPPSGRVVSTITALAAATILLELALSGPI